MTETPARRRAPGMSTENRREMIVAAALPLLVEHGAAVTTLQIAKAAGIGEATVFRAFADKDELLTACVAAALRNDHVLAELDTVPLDQPLAARLTEAAASLHAYLFRMGAVIAAAHGSPQRGTPTARGDRSVVGGRQEATERTYRAVIRLLEPDRASLRLPAEQLAAIFLGMLFGGRGVPGGPETTMETQIDVFLHGVLNPAAGERPA
jgi:AcrR family transcriptional regulator